MPSTKSPNADKTSAQEQGNFFGASLMSNAGAVPVDAAAVAAAATRVSATAVSVAAAAVARVDDNIGHRRRLRDRLRDGGAGAVPDYELLELILFRVFPRGDTKPIAKRLIAKFGSFAEVVSAPAARLTEVEGVGDRAVEELKLIKAAAERLVRGTILAKPALSSWSGVIDYLRLAQGFDAREQFRILFLDKKNNLIADEVQGHGTVDHTPVYVREVVKRALELSATAIILVHNHPSGDPTPSRADVDMTRQIMDAARPLGISVHDHIIVGREGHASLKGLKLI